jgi:ABC-type dipeptide/oligopeptide/nickel transport system ATPase component
MSDAKENVSAGETTFTFENIDYFVHHEGQEKQLLQHVSGYVKPGQLVALMGSSGAGKTTLMDVLAQRKDSGRIEGSIMVSLNCGGISNFGVPNSSHTSERAIFNSVLINRRRSMDGRKAYPSSAPLATASRTMYTSLLRLFWSHCCSLHDCVRVTRFQMRRKCSMCTASWIS